LRITDGSRGPRRQEKWGHQNRIMLRCAWREEASQDLQIGLDCRWLGELLSHDFSILVKLKVR
jgi:hypothetical protein